jgi:hypothetical protein
MKLFDDIFSWEGFGGPLRLGSGKCRLRIYDLKEKNRDDLVLMKPTVIIVSDLTNEKRKPTTMSVRSCAGHIATKVTQKFNINPSRMLYIEYYPGVVYGEKGDQYIPEKFDQVEFTWKEAKAIFPKWRPLSPPMLDTVKALVSE